MSDLPRATKGLAKANFNILRLANGTRVSLLVSIAAFTVCVCGCFGPANNQPVPAASDTDARIAYYRARIGGPGTYPAYARLGMAYISKAKETGEAKYYEDATEYLLKSLSYQPNFEALLGAANAFSERHEFKKALGYAEEAAATMPSDLDAQGALFDVYLAVGEVEKAEEKVQAMLRLAHGFAALTRLTALHAYRGEMAKAVEAMTKARDAANVERLSPSTRAWAEVRLGSLLVMNCEEAKARAAYGRALKIVPGYFFAHEHLAELDAAEGKLDAAISTYRDLLKKRFEPLYALDIADVYDANGDSKSAKRYREQARDTLNRSVRAGSKANLRLLAVLLVDEGDRVEGLRLAEIDWQNRQDIIAADTLAWAYFRNGKTTEAVAMVERALKSGTKDPRISLHAAEIYLSTGRSDSARSLLQLLRNCSLALGPSDQTRLTQLWSQLQTNAG